MDRSKMDVLDLSQDWSIHTPAFATYDGPIVKWIKRPAFDKIGGQHITSTLHVSTHLDAPYHFLRNFERGGDIASISVKKLVGPACVVDLEKLGLGDYDIFMPHHFEEWERRTGITIERGEILVIHTGYHKYYPGNWCQDGCRADDVDEEKYFNKHPGCTKEFAYWVLDRGISWLAIDAGTTDHPMNTVIRKVRPDLAAEAEQKLGKSCAELWPNEDHQITHSLLFRHHVFHAENLGGEIDKVLDQRVMVGCFPWRFVGGEAAFARFVAFVDK